MGGVEQGGVVGLGEAAPFAFAERCTLIRYSNRIRLPGLAQTSPAMEIRPEPLPDTGITGSLSHVPRLLEIELNTHERLDEARRMQWLGEVSALGERLRHIANKKRQAACASKLSTARLALTLSASSHP